MNHKAISPAEREAFTLDGFCETYSINRSAAYALIRDGKLKTFKLGRRRMVSKAAARDLLATLEREAA